MKHQFIALSISIAIVHVGCAPSLPPAEGAHRSAVTLLKKAGAPNSSTEERVGFYLASAAQAKELLDSDESGEAARRIYNKATADLTVLLRDSDQGRMWNHPLTVASGGEIYHMRFTNGESNKVWDPNYFSSFKPADEVKQKTIHRKNHQTGFGAALVGIRKMDPLERFSPRVGVTAPVTAVLDFKGADATLTLMDPSERKKAPLAGSDRMLEANFSAPLAYYPQNSELWNGLMGAIRVSHYMGKTGLFMLQPYDPDRIPLIFVHGLISTPQMWRNVINEIESDPTLLGRYQCWVFGYPTGNPPAYSALRLREELEKVRQLYPASKNYVLVGHSMGGLVSQMQATTVTRNSWDVVGKEKAAKLFAHVKAGSLVQRATIFDANPKVDRVIFICTPHRGSEVALGSLGGLGMRLISLPADLTATVATSIGSSVGVITGDSQRMPNSVTGLSPNNPTLKVLDAVPISAVHHTIAGDRGKGDGPESSDGVVKYWSSHLKTASSERIVPGPHGACELPETLDELRRILHLHLMGKQKLN